MMTKNVYPKASEAAQAMIKSMLQEINSRPEAIFRIALSGGSTPAMLFDVWASEFQDQTPWNRMHFYWVDERCVPPSSPDSNYGMAKRLLFDKIHINSTHIHRIVGELAPHEEALLYSAMVKSSLRLNEEVPEFDFIFLGIGADGHTSSVFPNQMELLTAVEPYVVSINPHNGQERIAMTGQPMIRALHTWFFVVGNDKEYILRQMFDEGLASKYPAGYVLWNARAAEIFTDIQS